MKALVLISGLGVVLATTVGCGSNSTPSTPASATSLATSNCSVKQLALTIDDNGGAAAGSTAFYVNFKNTSKTACTLDGFPGVSYVQAPDGEPVGAPAQRNGDTFGEKRLNPGDSVSSMVVATNVLNYPPIDCAPTSVAGLSVYPPNSFEAMYLPRPATACRVASAYQLSVTAIGTDNR